MIAVAPAGLHAKFSFEDDAELTAVTDVLFPPSMIGSFADGGAMNFQNTVVAATLGLLTCPCDRLAQAMRHCDRYFSSTTLYETDKPSVAVRTPSGALPLSQWVTELREAGPIACYPAIAYSTERLATAHKMAGFAGGLPWSLHLRGTCATSTYQAGTVSSTCHAMTLNGFADLINAQAKPDFFWEGILEQINQFHRANDIVEVEEHELADFLSSAAGMEAWNYIGDSLLLEAQVEALTFGERFAIPASMEHLVDKVVPFHDMIRWVPLSAYDDDEITGEHLHRLVMAQPFNELIWRQCADPDQLDSMLEDELDLENFPRMEAGAWRGYLQGLDEEDAEPVRDVLLALISHQCVRLGCNPVIPDELADIFGPDDEDRRRTEFRMRLQQDMGWSLAPQSKPWVMYVFDQGDAEAPQGTMTVTGKEKQNFTAALAAIEAFALKMDSPFAADFRLAQTLAANAQSDAYLDGAALSASLTSQGLTPEPGTLAMLELFSVFGWSAERVIGLAAISAADVFGAMGSWNDQSFEGDAQDQFEELSSRLFSAMNDYFTALLTFHHSGLHRKGLSLVRQYARQQLGRFFP